VPSLPVGRPIMLKLFGLDPSSHCGEVSRRMASPEKKIRLMSVPNFAEFLYAPNTAGHIDEASAVRLNNTTCETRMAWLIQKSCTRSINRYQYIRGVTMCIPFSIYKVPYQSLDFLKVKYIF